MNDDTIRTTTPSRFRRFLVLALLWTVCAYLVGWYLPTTPPYLALIANFLFAVPIAISGAYSSAAVQTRRASYFHPRGWAFRILSGRILRSLFWIAWALVSSLFMLIQFATYSNWDWIALLLLIPFFWIIYSRLHRWLSGELRMRFHATHFAILSTRRVGMFLLFALYALIIWLTFESDSFKSFFGQLTATKAVIPGPDASVVVQIGLELTSLSDDVVARLSGYLTALNGHLELALWLLSTFVVFFNTVATFSCFTLKRIDYRRVIGPITQDELPPPLTRTRLAVATAIVTVVAVFIYPRLFAHLEDALRRNPEISEAVPTLHREIVEKIDTFLYKPGTIGKVLVTQAAALQQVKAVRTLLDPTIDSAFAQLEGNVDSYLDWYYSLPAEYIRIAKMMTGDLERYMEAKLVEHLREEEAFKELSSEIKAALDRNKQLLGQYQLIVSIILEENRLDIDEARTTISRRSSLDEILRLPEVEGALSLDERLTGSVVGAGVGVGLGATIAAKIASKGLFKAAATAVTKAVAAKAAGTAGGAAIGALLGSIIPVAGTVVGGAIGGLIGGVIVDSALLSVDEFFSREEFKNEILDEIQRSKESYKETLFATKKL